MAYNGTVELIAGITPKNNGTFPLVHAKDVYVTDNLRLDDALNSLKNFDYTVCTTKAETPAGVTLLNVGVGTLAASVNTMYRIYLVKMSNNSGNYYSEYITIQNGSNYSWEQIGSTDIDLSGYATKAELDDYATKSEVADINVTAPLSSTITNGVLTGLSISTFEGATSSTAGSTGIVPAPSSGDNVKFLCGDGTWQTVSGGGSSAPDDTKADKTDTVLLTTLSRGRKADTTVGTGSFAFGQNVTASGMLSHAEGYQTIASATCAHAEGYNTTASGNDSHAEAYHTTASGNYSHAEGNVTVANGYASHSEGANTTAYADYSHAEGSYTRAMGGGSHAEGYYRIASGMYSHAEGTTGVITGYITVSQNDNSFSPTSSESIFKSVNVGQTVFVENDYIGKIIERDATNKTVTLYPPFDQDYNHKRFILYYGDASGDYSHAEGNQTTASGVSAHAEGFNTVAKGMYQHVFGAYNIEDTNTNTNEKGTYVEIVGNGTDSNARSNARTLDWNGNERLAGDITLNAGSNDQMSVYTNISALNTRVPTPTSNDRTKFLRGDGTWQTVSSEGGGSGTPVDLTDYARLNSPAFSGIPTAPTASVGTDTNQIATTAFVNDAIENLVSNSDGLYKIVEYRKENITINYGDYAIISDENVATEEGYTPVGIVGWATTGSGSTTCVVPRAYIREGNLSYYIRNNHGSSNVTINVVFWILHINNSPLVNGTFAGGGEGSSQEAAVIKNISVSFPSGSTSYRVEDTWITENTACYANSLSTLSLSVDLTWEFYNGYVLFETSSAPSTSFTFDFGMIKSSMVSSGPPTVYSMKIKSYNILGLNVPAANNYAGYLEYTYDIALEGYKPKYIYPAWIGNPQIVFQYGTITNNSRASFRLINTNYTTANSTDMTLAVMYEPVDAVAVEDSTHLLSDNQFNMLKLLSDRLSYNDSIDRIILNTDSLLINYGNKYSNPQRRSLALQSDGNAVIYGPDGITPLWTSDT